LKLSIGFHKAGYFTRGSFNHRFMALQCFIIRPPVIPQFRNIAFQYHRGFPELFCEFHVHAQFPLSSVRIVCDAMRCALAGCIRAVRCAARDAMCGGLVIGADGAMHGARIVCDAIRRDARDAMQYTAMHGMRCAGRCAANWL
jgi:hypothetical protein